MLDDGDAAVYPFRQRARRPLPPRLRPRGGPALLGGQTQEKTPAFPAEAELLVVDAVVLDATGNPVEGLTREDSSVSEDGKPERISSFEAIVLPESPAAAPRSRWRVSTNTEPSPRPERIFLIVFDGVTPGPQGECCDPHRHEARLTVHLADL